MPRRALRCVVDLKLKAVTAPGVWLPSREDVYVSISLFGQYKNTCLVESIFPLIVREDFTFEKTYYTALDPAEVVDYLDDEIIVFELLQLSEFGGANRLASYSSSARDFLYPAPSLAPCYASGAREILFHRSIDFPGISPKLEFVSITNIKESLSPELDALEDSIRDERRSMRRSRSRSRSRPVSRPSSRASTRSPSPATRWKSDDALAPRLSSTEARPPFVVRHLEKSLIGRTPGADSGMKGKGKKKGKRGRSRSRTRSVSAMSDSGGYYSDYTSYPSLTHKYRLKKSSSLDDEDPLPRASPKQFLSDDEDAEVAALTGSLDDLRLSRRSRSPSPLLYRPSLRERYGLRPLTPTEKLDLDIRVEQALRRSRSRERLARLELEESRSRSRERRRQLELEQARSKSRERMARLELELAEKRRERLAREELEESLRRARARYLYYKELEDLDLDTRLALSRKTFL